MYKSNFNTAVSYICKTHTLGSRCNCRVLCTLQLIWIVLSAFFFSQKHWKGLCVKWTVHVPEGIDLFAWSLISLVLFLTKHARMDPRRCKYWISTSGCSYICDGNSVLNRCAWMHTVNALIKINAKAIYIYICGSCGSVQLLVSASLCVCEVWRGMLCLWGCQVISDLESRNIHLVHSHTAHTCTLNGMFVKREMHVSAIHVSIGPINRLFCCWIKSFGLRKTIKKKRDLHQIYILIMCQYTKWQLYLPCWLYNHVIIHEWIVAAKRKKKCDQ